MIILSEYIHGHTLEFMRLWWAMMGLPNKNDKDDHIRFSQHSFKMMMLVALSVLDQTLLTSFHVAVDV